MQRGLISESIRSICSHPLVKFVAFAFHFKVRALRESILEEVNKVGLIVSCSDCSVSDSLVHHGNLKDREGVKQSLLGLGLAVGVVVDVDVSQDDAADVFNRKLWHVCPPSAILAEVWVVFVKLARETYLPHVVKLLQRHFSVTLAHGVSQHFASIPVNLNADSFHLLRPVWAILGEDIEVPVDCIHLALNENFVWGAKLREPAAELVAAVRIPIAEVLAVVRVPLAVALCAFPENIIIIVMVIQASTLSALGLLLGLFIFLGTLRLRLLVVF